MKPENKIINGLWIGAKLSPIELLTLHSFVQHGHIFHLWVYNKLENVLPEQVVLKDANTIIPASKIFRKKEADPNIGNGKGGLAMFSDIFRYKLLYEVGGWWVDMDVTCLKTFDFNTTYFFRSHPYFSMVNNVMKCPKGCELMKRSYEEAYQKMNADTPTYLLGNEILNKHVADLDLKKYIQDDVCNREWWTDLEYYIFAHDKPPKEWYFIHWINEEWRTQQLQKDTFYQKTRISHYMQQYNIAVHWKKRDLKYYNWHFKKIKVIQQLKPFFKQLPFYTFYQKYINS